MSVYYAMSKNFLRLFHARTLVMAGPYSRLICSPSSRKGQNRSTQKNSLETLVIAAVSPCWWSLSEILSRSAEQAPSAGISPPYCTSHQPRGCSLSMRWVYAMGATVALRSSCKPPAYTLEYRQRTSEGLDACELTACLNGRDRVWIR